MDNLIWISDYLLSGSSFGNVTFELTKRMKNYKVFVLSLGYSGQPITPVPGVDVLPLSSVNQLEYYFRKLLPERIVVFHSFYFLEKLSSIKFPSPSILYIPVEAENIPRNLVTSLVPFEKIIVPSKYSQNILKTEGLKSEVVYHGVDTSYYKPPQNTPEDFRWGYLGMNDVRKQIPRIMQAYSRLPIKTRGNLAIAAPNDGHYNLYSLAKTFKISPIFIEKKIHGIPLAKSNVLEFYHSLSCYVNCATEAFGLPNLEASACGLPTIALEHGASKEILKGGALYVKVSDYLDTNIGQIGLADRDDLYRKMKIILEVPPERKRLVKEGLDRAKELNWDKAIEKLEEILE